MLRELTSLSLNINNDTLVLSSVSEADPVTGGPAYKLSPSLLLGSHIQTMGEPVITSVLSLYPNLSSVSWHPIFSTTQYWNSSQDEVRGSLIGFMTSSISTSYSTIKPKCHISLEPCGKCLPSNTTGSTH